MSAPPKPYLLTDRMGGVLNLTMHALDRLANGDNFNAVIGQTGLTARVSELQREYGESRLRRNRDLALADPASPEVSAELRDAEAQFEAALDRLRSLGFEPAREGYARMAAPYVGLPPQAQWALLEAVQTGLFGVTKDADNANGHVDRVALKQTFEAALALARQPAEPVRVIVDVADGEVFAISAEVDVEAVVCDRDAQWPLTVTVDGEVIPTTRIADGGANYALCQQLFDELKGREAYELGDAEEPEAEGMRP